MARPFLQLTAVLMLLASAPAYAMFANPKCVIPPCGSGTTQFQIGAKGEGPLVNLSKMSDTLRNAGIKDIGSLKSADVGKLSRSLASLPVQVGKRTMKLGDVSKDAPRIAAQALVEQAKNSRALRTSTAISATSLDKLVNK